MFVNQAQWFKSLIIYAPKIFIQFWLYVWEHLLPFFKNIFIKFKIPVWKDMLGFEYRFSNIRSILA